MASKKSLGDLTEAELKGKTVFLHADLDVPLDGDQNIADDSRIRASVPTIKFLTEKGAKVILASHPGRPKGVTPKFSLESLVPRLSDLLEADVVMANDWMSVEDVKQLTSTSPDGGVVLLENVRFFDDEEKDGPEFAKKLASIADIYVNDDDAFLAHSSRAQRLPGVPVFDTSDNDFAMAVKHALLDKRTFIDAAPLTGSIEHEVMHDFSILTGGGRASTKAHEGEGGAGDGESGMEHKTSHGHGHGHHDADTYVNDDDDFAHKAQRLPGVFAFDTNDGNNKDMAMAVERALSGPSVHYEASPFTTSLELEAMHDYSILTGGGRASTKAHEGEGGAGHGESGMEHKTSHGHGHHDAGRGHGHGHHAFH